MPVSNPDAFEPARRPEGSERQAGQAKRQRELEQTQSENESELLPARRPAAEVDVPRQPVELSRYSPRFHFLYGVLLVVGIALIAGIVVLATRPASPPAPAWSAWHPADTSANGAQQIADYVAPRYRLPDGRQIVTVKGGPLQFQVVNPPVAVNSIVIKSSTPTSADAQVTGSSLLYTMCGDAANCSISTGKPSPERGLLLRREALELALYSFRYIDGADNVVAILPPLPKQKVTQAPVILLQRRDLSPMLDRPLGTTLVSPPPTLTNLAASPDLSTVSSITNQRIYHYGLQAAQDASILLELTRA